MLVTPEIHYSINVPPENSSHFGTKAYIFLRVRTEQRQIGVLPVKLFSLPKSCHFSTSDPYFQKNCSITSQGVPTVAKCQAISAVREV